MAKPCQLTANTHIFLKRKRRIFVFKCIVQCYLFMFVHKIHQEKRKWTYFPCYSLSFFVFVVYRVCLCEYFWILRTKYIVLFYYYYFFLRFTECTNYFFYLNILFCFVNPSMLLNKQINIHSCKYKCTHGLSLCSVFICLFFLWIFFLLWEGKKIKRLFSNRKKTLAHFSLYFAMTKIN